MPSRPSIQPAPGRGPRRAALLAGLALAAAACSPLSSVQVPALGGLPSAAPPAASAPGSAGPSAPAGGASPSASPASGSTAEAVAVIAAFRDWVASGTSFEVRFKGDSRHTTTILDVAGVLDVDGSNAEIRATFNFPGEGKGRTEWRLVKGTDWVKFDKAKWRRLAAPAPTAMVDPFAGARKGGTLKYLGPVEGEEGHYRFTLDAAYLHPVLIPAYNLTAEEITTGALELVVRRDGSPVRGTWHMKGKGRVSGQLQAVEIDLDLTYAKLGEDFPIRKP